MTEESWIRAWERIDRITRRLRAEDGCDWDRAQTPESLAPYLIEEIHEAIEALQSGSPERLIEEVGDALYLWIFFLQVLEDAGRISAGQAVRAIEEKLTRRHPHLFGGNEDSGSPDEGSTPSAWERRKLREGRPTRDVLPSLPAGFPTLLKARRIQEKAAAFGFDWSGAVQVLAKVREEIGELETEIARDPHSAAAQEELGDLLFALVNVARHLGGNPDAALQDATEKFRLRFNAMARSIEAAGHHIGDAPLDLMESHWNLVKDSGATENPREDRS